MYLEERLQDVEQQLKNMNRNGGRLMERVAELERGVVTRCFEPVSQDVIGLRNRIAALERAVYNCTDDALKEPITAKDVDRWRAIEKAARKVDDLWEHKLLGHLAMDVLKAALMGLRS